MRRHVRRNRATVNAHVWTHVWPTSVNRSSRKHDRGQRAIRATIDREVDLHREQLAVFRDGRLVTRARRVTLRCGDHVFRAIVDDLDRLARLPREQRRVSGNQRWILLLTAEAAACFCLNNPDLFFG